MELESSFLARVLIPYRRFEIVSELPREAAIARIKGIVKPGSPLVASLVRTNKLFAGDVSSDGFKLGRIIGYRNAMLPVIEGAFEPSPSGSRILVTMRLAHWVTGFFALWVCGSPIVFLLSELGLLSSKHGMPGLSYVFSLVFLYGFGAIGFNFEADRARALLEQALRATPSPHVERVLTNTAKRRLSRFVKVRLATVAVLVGVATLSWLFSPSSEFLAAQYFIQNNQTIHAELGSISSIERVSGDGFHKSETYAQDEGIFEVNVTGASKSGMVLFGMVRENRGWSIKSAQLREADGRTMLLAAPAAD
jgi:hypothetical protein